MLPVRHDLIGWFDTKLHRTYSPAEAEALFGARIYRQGQRPAHLQPLFEKMSTLERAQEYGQPEKKDGWISNFRNWGRTANGEPRPCEQLPTLRCRNGK